MGEVIPFRRRVAGPAALEDERPDAARQSAGSAWRTDRSVSGSVPEARAEQMVERPAQPPADADGSDADGSDADGSDADGSDADGSDAGGSDRNGSEEHWAVPVLGTGGVEHRTEVEPRPGARRAENVSLATLARHDASEGEVRARLVAKGLDEYDVDAELDRLRTVGLIDDLALAQRLISRYRERKGLGDAALRPALRARLIVPEVIDAALVAGAEDEDEMQDRLEEVAEDRARRLRSLPADVAERRLIAYLQRKGYQGSAVREAARAALASAD